MRVNKQIRASNVRVISSSGEQIGILSLQEALQRAEDEGIDLVEVVPGASPPVCKIIDYGKFRYDQTKREKESKKASHVIKVKEVKMKPNINEHDLQTKLKRAREFLLKGNKVKLTCMFRGREMAHPEIGENLVRKVIDELEDVATSESPLKRFGRFLTVVLAPSVKKKK
ncbi:MAG: Translation initiation factor IF-3 [Chlamydiae bacterium]|nr:Translation initiation factor IF-3 [Chlamydiota bacterium]